MYSSRSRHDSATYCHVPLSTSNTTAKPAFSLDGFILTAQDSRLLTDAELQELTGYTYPSRQCKALKESGVFFIVRKNGRPATTWSHVENPFNARNMPEAVSNQEPDFGAM